MKKINLSKPVVAAIAACILVTQLVGLHAAPAGDPPQPGTPSAAAPAAGKKATTHPYPFRGTVDAVDASAKTLELGGKKGERTLHVTAESVLERDGKPLRLEEVARGDYAKGLVTRPDGAREVVVKATFGPRPDAKARRRENSANR